MRNICMHIIGIEMRIRYKSWIEWYFLITTPLWDWTWGILPTIAAVDWEIRINHQIWHLTDPRFANRQQHQQTANHVVPLPFAQLLDIFRHMRFSIIIVMNKPAWHLTVCLKCVGWNQQTDDWWNGTRCHGTEVAWPCNTRLLFIRHGASMADNLGYVEEMHHVRNR